MTKTTSEVARECTHARVQGRAIIVKICEDDTLEFRLKGRRTKYSLPIAAALEIAARKYGEAERAEKDRANGVERKVRRSLL